VERWLPVPGWEGSYEVSDLGRVRSVTRRVAVTLPHGRPRCRGGVTWRTYQGKLLVPWYSNGYPLVTLTRGKAVAKTRVGVLVLRAFRGDPEPGQEVRHGPGGKADSRLVNLCWGTRKENFADRLLYGEGARGERQGSARLTEADVREIRRLRAEEGLYMRQIAARYPVCTQTICNVLTGKTWAHVDKTSQIVSNTVN
jgi:hypothetical protein